MTDTDDSQIQIEVVSSVGERLRLAREERKLTVVDIASELRLVRGNVEHIENGQWEELHGRAYALGYFTSYVKFLNMPQDEMLAAFNTEYKNRVGETPPLKGLNDSGVKKGKTGLLLIFILLLTVVAWFSYQQWLSSNIEDNQDVEPEPVVNNEPIVSEQQSEIDVEQPVILSDDAIQEILPSNKLNLEQTEEIIEAKESEVSSLLNEEEMVSSKTEFSVDLEFTEDCWVEVTDANAKTLLSQIMKMNSKMTLVGKPPFTVLLGRASATIVKVNDKVFDTEPYTHRNVARFKLGADS